MRAGWFIGAASLFGAAVVQAAPVQRPFAMSCSGAAIPDHVVTQPAPVTSSQLERGRKLVEQAQCGRCHTLPATVAATPRQRSCAGCHAWIRSTREDPAAAARERRRYPLWDRYMATVSS